MDEDEDSVKTSRRFAALGRRAGSALAGVAAGCGLMWALALGGGAQAAQSLGGDALLPWQDYLPPSVIVVLLALLALSAFFSSCETAFFSIPRPRLRSMREEDNVTARLVVQMLDDPGRFLTMVLVGNMLVNTMIGVVLGSRVEEVFEKVVRMHALSAYVAATAITTGVLLMFGEITPKVFAVRARETYARAAVLPLVTIDKLLAPIRDGLLRLTNVLFRVTHFHELRAAPFITDEELKSVFSNGQAKGVIEEEGRQMIRRILEFHDVQLGEILVPRPDIIAVPEDATVAEALAVYREYEYSRMPVYKEDLDHITGVLFAKDLLPSLSKGATDAPVQSLVRPPHFVPETMSVHQFIKNVQRLRSHLAIVVDEYGGTEGIVTLHDAIEEVVGDIRDEKDEEPPPYERISDAVYRVEGSLPLDELSELIGIPIQDEEHQTVAGFLMNQTDKVPEVGDQIVHSGVMFTVEEVEGKRAAVVRIEISPERQEGA